MLFKNAEDKKPSNTWKCDAGQLAVRRQIIIDLKIEFNDDSIENIRYILQILDDGSCTYSLIYLLTDESSDLNLLEEKKGHPLPVHLVVVLAAWLHKLRATAVHYPILRTENSVK